MQEKTGNLDVLRDHKGNCYSVMLQVKIGDYLEFVGKAYEKRGGIEGQRDALKTNTAIRIRQTMVDDLSKGAILPPIVVGVVVSEQVFDKIHAMDSGTFVAKIKDVPEEKVFIIDGMQRTTALIEAINKFSFDGSDISKGEMRAEFWVATDTNSLIYRMLVLNTGQVPWNLRRQIEVVFSSVIKEIKEKVPGLELVQIDDGGRRAGSGKFQADRIIELFLVFGARKEKVDTKERLADEFTRLDFIEATSGSNFTEMFYDVLRNLALLDVVFGAYQSGSNEERFSNGADLFSSQPACVGFVTAIAIEVLGRPGSSSKSEAEENERMKKITTGFMDLIRKLSKMTAAQIGIFLDFSTLNELVSERKSGKVGEFEREFFLKAFQVLIEEDFNPETMTPCWRAY